MLRVRFSVTVRRGDQLEVLVDEADTVGPRISRVRDRHGDALDGYGPRIGPHESAKDVQERALACSVLSQDTVYLTGPQLELSPVERGYRSKASYDAVESSKDSGHDPPGPPSTKGTLGTSSVPARMLARASSIASSNAAGTRSVIAGFTTKSITSPLEPA